MKKETCPGGRRKIATAMLAVLLFAGTAHAAHEVTDYDLTGAIPLSTPSQRTTDLNVSWNPPTNMGTDTLVGYVYQWNRSSAADTTLDRTSFTTNGGFIDANSGLALATLAAANFTGDDGGGAGDFWYLHLRTEYLDSNLIPTYSSDLNLGPFFIDNVVTGTIAVVDPDTGAPLTETRETQVSVQVGAPTDISAFYLADTSAKPGTATTIPQGGTVTFDLTDATPGDKTLYAWFTDTAGNTSTVPVNATFTLLDALSISPNTATIDLSGANSQIFTMAGAGASTFDWTISAETPVTPGDTVCQLSGTTTGVASVTMTGANPGTCVLQATPSGGGTAVTSGTITVSGTTANLDIDGSGTATALGDGVLIVRYLFGFTGNTLINGVVDAGCTRCTATDIETYLATAKTDILDIDGNGTATALGDGVLVVRSLFGFTGNTLISGVVDNACTVCTATEIETAITNLKP
ncbi:MAG: hypothetical protein AB1568_06650 [Thermodesulfobacteriota bacterium]